MCGIAGYFLAEMRKNTPILKMAESIAHRGPDDQGFVLADALGRKYHTFASSKSPEEILKQYPLLRSGDDVPMHSIAMAHTRYSIIDLSANGHQPMWSMCGRYCITFNGEIYNYIEIREALKSLGRIFLTQSDTEVLLQSYIEWGVGMFERLNGFFAIAIYDVHRQQVLLGRDRIGVAHLYLTIRSQAVHWASEIKALIQAGEVDVRSLDTRSVADFLIYGRRDRAGTFWPGVVDFPAGHYAWVGPDCKVNTIRYWAMPTKRKTTKDIGIEEAENGLREVLINSLELRLRADVQIGFELSGGLDSSALVGLAAGAMGRKIDTYTIKFDEAHSDEEPYARAVAQRYPELINYKIIRPPQDEFWKGANTFVWEQEEPFHSPNLFTSQSMQRIIKEHGANVVISGAGGDEVLAGYANDYLPPYLIHLLVKGDLNKFLAAINSSTELAPMKSILLMSANLFIVEEQRNRIRKKFTGEYGLLKKILSGNLMDLNIQGALYAKNISFHSQSISNMTTRLMNYWLRSGMKSSIAIPVEPRSPFLDYRVVEFGLSLPPEYLIENGFHKYLLRKVIEPYLPSEVVWRRNKMGFPFPYREWLIQSKSQILANMDGNDCPFIDKKELLANYDKLNEVAPMTLWRIASLILWWRRVVNGNSLKVG